MVGKLFGAAIASLPALEQVAKPKRKQQTDPCANLDDLLLVGGDGQDRLRGRLNNLDIDHAEVASEVQLPDALHKRFVKASQPVQLGLQCKERGTTDIVFNHLSLLFVELVLELLFQGDGLPKLVFP